MTSVPPGPLGPLFPSGWLYSGFVVLPVRLLERQLSGCLAVELYNYFRS